MHNTLPYEPPFELPTQEYYQLVHTLTAHLPLPDRPEALRSRNQAALAQVAALMPVNAAEVGLATQCIAARAQAEDVLRQIRKHDGDDIRIVIAHPGLPPPPRTSIWSGDDGSGRSHEILLDTVTGDSILTAG